VDRSPGIEADIEEGVALVTEALRAVSRTSFRPQCGGSRRSAAGRGHRLARNSRSYGVLESMTDNPGRFESHDRFFHGERSAGGPSGPEELATSDWRAIPHRGRSRALCERAGDRNDFHHGAAATRTTSVPSGATFVPGAALSEPRPVL
jgi:hypothetical protein